MSSERDANVTTGEGPVTPYSEDVHQTREGDLWVPAAVELSGEGDWLRYRDSLKGVHSRRFRPGKRMRATMLAGFLDLANGLRREPDERYVGAKEVMRTPDGQYGVVKLRRVPEGGFALEDVRARGPKVLAFARRWGMLALCERHFLPCSHARLGMWRDDAHGDEEPDFCEPMPVDGVGSQVFALQHAEEVAARGGEILTTPDIPAVRGPDQGGRQEPVARWLEYSAEFSEVLALVMKLRAHPPRYWVSWPYGRVWPDEMGRYVPAEELLHRTQQWQDHGHVRDVLQWTQGGLVRVRAGSGLFGALVIELLDAIEGGAQDMFRCENCGEPGQREGRYRIVCDKPECKRARTAKRAKASRERRRNRVAAGAG